MSDVAVPECLRPLYSSFLAGERILLTGHSHQAWPDVAREGLLEAWNDAAEHVDDKWAAAIAKADAVRAAVSARIGGAPDQIALGQSSHELVTRFLSALDFQKRPRLVTTTGEFHSMHRQLRRLASAYRGAVQVTFVAALPVDTLAERLAAEVDERTAAVLVSNVLFETASIVPGLAQLTEVAHEHGAEVLYDAYHAFNVVPFSLAGLGADPVWVTAGGYKYAQWGEGVCFLRVPPGTELEPVYTGWFSDFARLDEPRGGPIRYGPRGADRFAGSTYDPVSHYRAARVAAFFDEHGLSVERLRELSLRQTARLIDRLDGFDVVTPRAAADRGGFVSVRVREASRVVAALRERGVFADSRGDLLRFGPAPYTTDDEIDRAVTALREVVRSSAP